MILVYSGISNYCTTSYGIQWVYYTLLYSNQIVLTAYAIRRMLYIIWDAPCMLYIIWDVSCILYIIWDAPCMLYIIWDAPCILYIIWDAPCMLYIIWDAPCMLYIIWDAPCMLYIIWDAPCMLYIIWDVPCENVSSGICGQRMFRSVCIRVVWSGPSLSAYRNIWYCRT